MNPPNAASIAGNLADSISLVIRSETDGQTGEGDSHFAVPNTPPHHGLHPHNIQDPDLTPK